MNRNELIDQLPHYSEAIQDLCGRIVLEVEQLAELPISYDLHDWIEECERKAEALAEQLKVIRRALGQPNVNDFNPDALREMKYFKKADYAHRSENTEVIEFLAVDEDSGIRRCVAMNPNTSSEVLGHLSRDPDRHVRQCVAHHWNTPLWSLNELCGDGDQFIRMDVAMNANASPEILTQLKDDRYHIVRQYVVRNPNTPIEVLRELANGKGKDLAERARIWLEFRLRSESA